MGDERRRIGLPRAPARAATAARTLIFAFVAVLALDHYGTHLARTPGIDFYQYWAVPTARRVSLEPLGSPYADSDRYAEVLRDVARRSTDPRLAAVTEYRSEPDFASDPLLYVIGSWLPADYSVALRTYQMLQFVALALALALLSRRASLPALETATLGLLMAVYYMPVLSELRVLNTNALQLAALAGAAWLLPPREERAAAPRLAAGLSLTVLVAFLKPLWAPLPALAALYAFRHHGSRALWKGAAVAGVFGLALAAWPATVFGPAVWSEWYHDVFRANPSRLLYGIEEGNRSAAMILARATGWSVGGAASLLGGLLVLAAILVLARRAARTGTRGAAESAASHLLARPETALGLGIVGMLALSPLVWWHYHTLALVPQLALLSPRASRAQAALAGLSLLLASGRLGPVYAWLGNADSLTVWGAGFAWLPLWVALFLPGADDGGARVH